MLMYRMKAVLEPGHSHSFSIVCGTSITLEAAISSHFTEGFAIPGLKTSTVFLLTEFQHGLPLLFLVSSRLDQDQDCVIV